MKLYTFLFNTYLHETEQLEVYSYRIASSGLRVDARFAGKIPVKYPTPAEKRAINTRKVNGKENRLTD